MRLPWGMPSYRKTVNTCKERHISLSTHVRIDTFRKPARARL
jgi:hypothetical protein